MSALQWGIGNEHECHRSILTTLARFTPNSAAISSKAELERGRYYEGSHTAILYASDT